MKRPLDSQKIVVTRPGLAGEELCLMLGGLGAQVDHRPAIAIQIMPIRAADHAWLNRAAYVLITSAHACTSLAQIKLGSPNFTVLAVGEQTANLAKQHGWKVEVACKTGGLADLVTACESLDFDAKQVVWPRSNLADKQALGKWQSAGAQVHDFVAYEVSNPLMENPVDMDGVTAVFFASPSSAKNLESCLDADELERIRTNVHAFAIGRTTAKELRGRGWKKIEVASRPSNEGLLAASLEHLSESEWR
ncbi:MAG: uroporphyrinogen-III synthase [Planctomycetota bacterium]